MLSKDTTIINGMVRTKDSKSTKDGNGEQALDKCRHSLYPVANELALIASSSIYEDRIRKAAKRAEQLVDEARHVLFIYQF